MPKKRIRYSDVPEYCRFRCGKRTYLKLSNNACTEWPRPDRIYYPSPALQVWQGWPVAYMLNKQAS